MKQLATILILLALAGCGSNTPRDTQPQIIPPETQAEYECESLAVTRFNFPGLIGQSAERIDGSLYLLSSESQISTAKVIEIDEEVNVVWEGSLYVNGVPLLAHPTALAVKEGYPSLLAGNQEWYVFDWGIFKAEGNLDNAIINVIPDPHAIQFMRAEYIELNGVTCLATGDYTRPDGNQLRLYNPKALAGSNSTLDDGVMVATYDVPGYVQSYSWERGVLWLVGNAEPANGWALYEYDLEQGEVVFERCFVGMEMSELEGYRIFDDGRELFLTGDPGGVVWEGI